MTMRKLLSLLRGKDFWMSILTPILIVGEVIMEVAIPKAMSKIVDIGIANRDIDYVLKAGGVMALMALVSLFFGAMAAWTASIASMGFGRSVRQSLFYRVQDFSFSNIDRFSTSSLITRMTTDITNLQNAFMMVIRTLVRAPIMFISASVMAFSINAELSCIFLVAVPILGTVLAFTISKAHPRFKKMLRCFDKLNAKIQENLIGIRVVKAFVRGDYEDQNFDECADAVRQTQIRAERMVILNMPIMQMMVYLCIILVLWLGGNMIVAGQMGTGELVSFISYVNQILMSLMMIAFSFTMLVISKASVSRIVEVLNDTPDIPDHKDSDIAVSNGSIAFEDVSFSYQGDLSRCALEHINLQIRSGETIGIIGGTGSAKSTLVHLIPRLYEATEGAVKVGGVDVKDYRQKTLRDQVAMVLQKNVLFSGTIRENLRWGNPDATDEEIVAACKAAQAHDFIMEFPNGYDTELGQGGLNVSGGQKQRLCIARALLKKPKIVILDDSTSAVDTATDSKIRASFRKELSDTTTIIIAQRISSVSDADRIVVLEEGKISAVGTHDELLKSSEIYREVYESQQKGVA